MKVLVSIKQVADTEARIIIGSDKKGLEIENKYAVNFFDEFAVEEAIKLKEANADTEITVCTYGPERTIEALRTTIAMGADKAFLINSANYEADDPSVIAQVIAAFAKRESFDLILCGRQAIDDENANIGPMIAEYLGIPHVSRVTKLTVIDAAKISVESEIEGGKKVSEVALPALLTAQKGLNEPRVPLITGVMKAMRTEIPVIDPAGLEVPAEVLAKGASKMSTVSYEPPPQRPPVKMIPGETPEEKVAGLIKVLKEEAKAL